MEYQLYLGIIFLAALVFSVTSRFAQERLMDRKLTLEIQQESKNISDELKKAKERNDQRRMDELNKKQLDLLPKMQKMMFGQLKLFAVIIGLFLAFSWAITSFDATSRDDVVISLRDDGVGCDRALDGVYSACYENVANLGEWSVKVQAFDGEAQTSESTIYFFVGDNGEVPNRIGQLNASTDKRMYQPGETVVITVVPEKATSVKATFDLGTSSHLDLPFVIPIMNTARIRTASGVFVSLVFVLGLIISFIIGMIRRIQKTGEKK